MSLDGHRSAGSIDFANGVTALERRDFCRFKAYDRLMMLLALY